MSVKTYIIPGTRHGKLTVISELDPRVRSNGNPRRVLLCKCECGTEKEILYQSFSVFRVRSCGCEQKEVVRNGKFAKTHGLSNHPLFTVWKRMLDRCYDPRHKSYKHYGGRGITICDAWKNSCSEFVSWGESNGYKEGLEIDREENDGNYDPNNCRFVTRHVNAMNRRCTKRYLLEQKH